jgi:hypothetical protein
MSEIRGQQNDAEISYSYRRGNRPASRVNRIYSGRLQPLQILLSRVGVTIDGVLDWTTGFLTSYYTIRDYR